MAITRNVTQVYNGPSASGQILTPVRDLGLGLGVPAPMTAVSISSIWGGDSVSNTAAYSGFRVINAMNLSTNRYISWTVAHNNLARSALHTWANGGMRIVFEDASGNWSAFNLYGSDLQPFGEAQAGGFAAFAEFAAGRGSAASAWILERNRTPVASSGVVNWASIAAYEVHFRPSTSGRMQGVVGRILTTDLPLHTGTVSSVLGVLDDVANTFGNTGANWSQPWVSRRPPLYVFGSASAAWSITAGLQVGNGSTSTTLNLSSTPVAFWPLPEDVSATVLVPNGTQIVQDPRLIDVFQSAADSVTFNDCVFSGSAAWGFRLRGTPGAFSSARTQWVRYAQMDLAHGAYTDCIWSGGTVPVLVNTSTTITRGIVRDATAGGLTITSGPGVYSNIDCDFSGNASFDVSMGSGGAGTYELTNVGVVGAYTLKIRNDSATNAITVAIPAGISYTTSTAGGLITISTPAVYQSVTVNGLVAGSRLQIYDTTADVELANVITGTSYTWTDPNPAAANRAIRVRIAYVSGTDARLFIDQPIGTAGTLSNNAALSYLANQSDDDDVYIANAIDGSAVTGITISDSIDRMIINIAGGSVSWPQIYAYNVYWLHTEEGIRDDGAIIAAVDTANYRVTGFKIRNSSTTPLSITGGYGVDTATGSVASLVDAAGSTGNIYQTPDIVIAYATGSGLAPDERAKLMAAATETTAQQAAQNAALAAALSA